MKLDGDGTPNYDQTQCRPVDNRRKSSLLISFNGESFTTPLNVGPHQAPVFARDILLTAASIALADPFKGSQYSAVFLAKKIVDLSFCQDLGARIVPLRRQNMQRLNAVFELIHLAPLAIRFR